MSNTRGGVFQFEVKQSRIAQIKPAALTKERTAKVPYVIHPVQGIMPDSKEEFWIAQGLYAIGMKFYYQYRIAGGSRVKGGQIIDFWLLTPILPTPLLMNGVYWHSGARAADDNYKLMELRRIFRGKIYEPIIIWDYEIPTPDMAKSVVKARVKR